jgi:glycosyltransferase involved in cell wall biosynthesis
MQANKRVLIISYYWPPSGGAGVQRWLKFVKFLPKNGWTPVVYTPSNPEFPSIDTELEKEIPPECEVTQTPIREPYALYKKLMGAKKEDRINAGFLNETGTAGRKEQLARWVRGNYFIPDARKFWIKPSVKYLQNYLAQNPVDLIITTGPPHSMHVIGLQLKKQLNLPWIADFRDPWTNIDFYQDLHLSDKADRKHHQLESAVLNNADTVLVIGQQMKKEFGEITDPLKIHVVPNGFDPADFPKNQTVVPDPHFSLAHIGSFSPARNVPVLWEALSELIKENEAFKANFRLKLIGKVDASVTQSLIDFGLEDHLERHPYLPHGEVLTHERSSSVLLLSVNDAPNAKGIVTGKVFEYFFAQRPILAIGPEDGDLAQLIRETETGQVVERRSKERMMSVLRDMFIAWQGKKLNIEPKNISRFNREELTTELDQLMRNTINHTQE